MFTKTYLPALYLALIMNMIYVLCLCVSDSLWYKTSNHKCLTVLGTSTVTEEDLFLQQCEDVPQVRVSTLNEALLIHSNI